MPVYTDSNGVDWSYKTGSSTTTLGSISVNSYTGALVIPATLGGIQISAINDDVLNANDDSNANNITSVSFDPLSNVLQIGSNFCANMSNLYSLIIPDTVQAIGDGLCSGSTENTNLSLTISKNVINDGTNLTNLLSGAKAVSIHLITPFVLDDAFINTFSLTALFLTCSNGNNAPIGCSADPTASNPFQNLSPTTSGTLYVSYGISNQEFAGGSPMDIGGGKPNSWGVVPFAGEITSGSVVPCFVKGNRILTPDGYKCIETFAQGDLVVTSDGRQVPVKFFAKRLHTTDSKTAPYHIPAHSFGHNQPSHELRLSPDHAFQLRKGVWMTGRKGASLSNKVKQYGVSEPVVYYHLECPDYLKDNLIIEGGVIVESYAGRQTNFKSPYTYSEKLKGYTRPSTIVSINQPTLQK
jgi:Hint domain